MVVTRPTQRTARLLLLLTAGLFVIGLTALVLHLRPLSSNQAPAKQPTAAKPVSPPPGLPGNSGDAAKSRLGSSTPTPPSAAPAGSTSSPQQTNAYSVTIVRAGQLGKGQDVQVRTIVSGSTTGTCNATYTAAANGATFTRSGPVTFDGSTTYSCSGLDVPATGFNPMGNWSVTVTVTNGTTVSAPSNQKFYVSQ